jgi:hypothetical protein
MKKDIEFPQNQNLVLAIAPSDFEQWDVFLINSGSKPIKNILVSSSGFGFDDKGDKISTSTLRHFFDDLNGASFLAIEKIDPSVFHLNNEYWISYWIEGTLFDRRFLFVPDSITKQNCIQVNILNKSAILHT